MFFWDSTSDRSGSSSCRKEFSLSVGESASVTCQMTGGVLGRVSGWNRSALAKEGADYSAAFSEKTESSYPRCLSPRFSEDARGGYPSPSWVRALDRRVATAGVSAHRDRHAAANPQPLPSIVLFAGLRYHLVKRAGYFER